LDQTKFPQILNNTVNIISGLVLRQEGSLLISRISTVCIWAIFCCLAVMNLKTKSRYGKSLLLRSARRKLATYLTPCLVFFTRGTWITFNTTFL